METKIFALKMPIKLKRSMEYISKEVNSPLSRLYLPSIEKTTKKYLGIIIIHNLEAININKTPNEDKLKNLTDINSYINTTDLSPIQEFVGLMENSENQERFLKYFQNIKMSKEKFSYQSINIAHICESLGEKLLNTSDPVNPMDMDKIKKIFVEEMIKNYFNFMAIGTISQLQREWEIGKSKLEVFTSHLLNLFDQIFQTTITVEPIDIE